MNLENKLKYDLTWMSCFLVAVLTVFFNLRFSFISVDFLFPFLIILFFIFLVLFIFSTILRKKTERKFLYDTSNWTGEEKISILVTEKNENSTIIKSIKNFLTFPENVKIKVYDDSSDDGTFRMLKKIEREFPKRISIKQLIRSMPLSHPKAEAMKDHFSFDKSDFYFIADADTTFEFEDLKKAISFMKKKNLGVLHFSRRNNSNKLLSTRIADSEEIFYVLLKIFKLLNWHFTGSGYILSKESAEILRFNSNSPSEDTEIGRQIRERKIRNSFSLNLFVCERAPKKYKFFFIQRAFWSKMAVYHMFENEPLLLLPLTFLATSTITFFLNLGSISTIFFLIASCCVISATFVANLIIAGRNFFISFLLAVLLGFTFWAMAVVFLFFVFAFPLRRKKFLFKKTILE